MNDFPSLETARELDAQDPLAKFRDQFHIPSENGKQDVYLAAVPKAMADVLLEHIGPQAENFLAEGELFVGVLQMHSISRISRRASRQKRHVFQLNPSRCRPAG